MTLALLQGSFSSTGESNPVDITGQFNLSLSGFGAGTVEIQRSFDGVEWHTIESYTGDTQKRGCEPEFNVKYRLRCSSYTSGTINYRISR